MHLIYSSCWCMGNGIRLQPLQNKIPNVYVVQSDPQHLQFHSAAINSQNPSCYHKTLIVPVFPFHFFLHFSAFKPWATVPTFLEKWPWEYKGLTDHGQWPTAARLEIILSSSVLGHSFLRLISGDDLFRPKVVGDTWGLQDGSFRDVSC